MTNKSVDCFFVASLLLSNDGVIDCHENPHGFSHNDGNPPTPFIPLRKGRGNLWSIDY
nr:hypothetical protein [Helicobacter macacae]